MFFEKNGELFTPATGHILPGITRATVFEMCEEFNIPVTEKQVTLEELKTADAAFFCGTAAEVIGWESIDGLTFKKNWNSTLGRKLQVAYKDRVIEKVDEVAEETSSLSKILIAG